MITEDYVSFETAKLLKEKGFDPDECEVHYDPYNHLEYEITLQMAMKWLRETHNINIVIIPTLQEKLVDGRGFVREYCSNIYNDNNIIQILGFITGYENACEAAIKYCLENLI